MKNSPQMSQMDADKEVRNLEAACLVFNLRMKKGGVSPNERKTVESGCPKSGHFSRVADEEFSADKEVKDLEAACLVFNLRSSAQSEDEEGGRPQMSLKQYNPDARNLVISRELPMKNSPQIKRLRIWKPPA